MHNQLGSDSLIDAYGGCGRVGLEKAPLRFTGPTTVSGLALILVLLSLQAEARVLEPRLISDCVRVRGCARACHALAIYNAPWRRPVRPVLRDSRRFSRTSRRVRRLLVRRTSPSSQHEACLTGTGLSHSRKPLGRRRERAASSCRLCPRRQVFGITSRPGAESRCRPHPLPRAPTATSHKLYVA